MHRILYNRHYTSVVTYNGMEYKVDHEPLIDEATFDRVQALMIARDQNKDKAHKRPHHLKGNLFCPLCGRRFGITAPTNQYGTNYPYFYCLGRQFDKASCSAKYMPVGLVEQAVRSCWSRVRLPQDRIPVLRQVAVENFTGKHAAGRKRLPARRRGLPSSKRSARRTKMPTMPT